MHLIRPIILTVIGWCLLLMTVHYFNQRPLWNDEAYVLTSLSKFSPARIFSEPLNDMQQFPRLYLLLIQTIAGHCHFSLLSLRFLPFVFMILAFLLWIRIADRTLSKN